MTCKTLLLSSVGLGMVAFSQPLRTVMSSAEAAQMENRVRGNARDLTARSALLRYYFTGMVSPAEAIPARRRHILWLIENAPADPLLLDSTATIDATGHSLADPAGFQRASEAWRAQTAKPDAPTAALVNAALFFKLTDKNLAMKLLETVTAREPANREYGARLGDVYALSILGVTMINQNGFPSQADPRLTRSPAAVRAREALQTSLNPYALAKAGYMLAWQGSILLGARKLNIDPFPSAKNAVERAVQLAPGQADVAAFLGRYNELQRIAGRGARAVTSARKAAPAPKALGLDWSKVELGMKREDLLKLGAPAGKLSSPEEGRLLETFQYAANGIVIGRVRLTDGVVTRVERE